MNKRIEELADQCNWQEVVVEDGEEWIHAHFDKQKFAELIVQECIDIISPYTIRMGRPGEEYFHPILEIRKNFGVEE